MKMKTFFFYTLLLIVTLLFLSCENQNKSNASAAGNDPKDTLSYIQKLKETNAKIEQLMLASDYDSVLKYFTKDVLVLPPTRKAIRGIDAMREDYEENKRRGIEIRAFGGKVEKMWRNGNIVYEYGTYGSAGTVRGHPKPIAQTGNYFMMWERQNDGSYLIKYIIENLDYDPCN